MWHASTNLACMNRDAELTFVIKPLPTGAGNLLYAWFPALHTRIDLLLWGEQPAAALQNVASRIRQLLTHYEAIGNYFDPESELGRLNRTAHLRPQRVSSDLFSLLTYSRKQWHRSGGLFDVTIHSIPHLPDTMEEILLSPSEQSVHWIREGIRIDLSGLLKGAALDAVCSLLRQEEVENALVNLGNSSILARGNHPHGTGWKVSISGTRTSNDYFLLQNECLTTSGNNSPHHLHIMHPPSGTWVKGERRVSVVTPSGAEGEVLSTALFAASPDQQQALLETYAPRRVKL